MGADAAVRIIKPGSVNDRVVATHPMANATGKESGTPRSLVRDFFLKSMSNQTGRSLDSIKRDAENWNDK